jgi:dTDP-4-dehydrorhamnose reductase
MIGLELSANFGLVEWFLSQKGGHVRGFSGAIYTGFTTLALARIISRLIDEQPDLQGLWHVSSEAISKYDLLEIVNNDFRLGIQIERDEAFHCDRSLDSTAFRRATNIEPLSWDQMIREMAADATSYERLI